MGRVKGSKTGCNDRFGGICSVEGCGKTLRAKGLCPGHLYRFNKYGIVDLPIIRHRTPCIDCGTETASRGKRPKLRCDLCLTKQNTERVNRWLAQAPLERVRQTRKQAKANRTARKFAASGRHTKAEFLALCERLGWACSYCGCGLTEETATRDHIVPLSRGGSNSIENIAPACDTCNKRKHARTPDEWAALSLT